MKIYANVNARRRVGLLWKQRYSYCKLLPNADSISEQTLVSLVFFKLNLVNTVKLYSKEASGNSDGLAYMYIYFSVNCMGFW